MRLGKGSALVHCRVNFWHGILSVLHINQNEIGGKDDEEWEVEKDSVGGRNCVCGVNGGDDAMGPFSQEHHSRRSGGEADHEGV